MKKKILVSVIIISIMILFFTFLVAAKQLPDSARHQQQIRAIATELNISEQKAAEVHRAFVFNQPKITAAFKDRTLTSEQRTQLIKQLAAERQIKIDAVLTKEQYQKLMDSPQAAGQESVRRKMENRAKDQFNHPVRGGHAKSDTTNKTPPKKGHKS